MAVPQSDLQGFIQNMAGTQSTAQANVPGALSAGNPNTAYNWASYLPQVTPPAQAGGLPSVGFNLIQAPAQIPGQANGYVPPFTPDPYAAMLMAGMPQTGSNDNVNRILGNLFGGNNSWGSNPGTPGTPGTPGPGTPGPGAGTPPASPIGNGGSGGSRPVGPISGPIHQWITNPLPGQGVPNTTAPTNLSGRGLGRQGALTWLNQNQGSNFVSVQDWLNDVGGWNAPEAQAANEEGTGWLQNAANWIGDQIGEQIERVGNWSGAQWIDALTEFLVPGDFVNDETGEMNDPMTILGINQIVDFFRNNLDPDSTPTQAEIDALLEEVSTSQAATIQEQAERSHALIAEGLRRNGHAVDGLSREEILERFPDFEETWSESDWQDMLETVDWNNFWDGNDQANSPTGAWSGTRRPTLGLPALDNMDVFLNQMNQNNLGISEWFRNMSGTRMQ